MPLSFTQLTVRFELGRPREAARRYVQAVEKAHATIPGSELAFWVVIDDP